MVKVIRQLVPNKFNGITEARTVDFFMDNNYYEILKGFRKAVYRKNTSVVFVFDGRSGMGKTTLGIQTGIAVDKDFGLHKIHFTPKTFLQGDEATGKVGLSNCKKGDFILFDEAMLISNRSAMSKINKMIIQAMSMIRSKNIFVGFCVNSLFDIDRNLILHRAEALFHVYGDTLVSRGRFCGFYRGKDGFNRLKDLYLNGKRLYDYSKPRANMVARFSSEFLIDDKVYETQKQKGIDEFLNAKTQKGLDKRKVAVKMLKRKRSIGEICEVLSLSLPDYNKLMEGDVNFEELA